MSRDHLTDGMNTFKLQRFVRIAREAFDSLNSATAKANAAMARFAEARKTLATGKP